MKLFLFISLTILTGSGVASQEVTEAHKDSINNMLNQYYELNLKMFQAGSTKTDIDKAFALFSDNFTYVHAKFDGFYTKESLYESALRNQNNGRYNGTVLNFKL